MAFLIKKIVPLVLLLATFLVGYNYFFGTKEEQESSREIIEQVKKLSSSVVKLLGSEKEKYQAGKYDGALEKVKSTFAVLKEKATQLGAKGQQIVNSIEEMEQEEIRLKLPYFIFQLLNQRKIH